MIYKIVTREQWQAAQSDGAFAGAPVDLADGYIHFSGASQLRETADRHFAGQFGLLLVSVDAAMLGSALRWETSRGGELFPHLYAPLQLDAVTQIVELPLNSKGRPVFGEDIPR